ncbi:MAG: glutathione S-transferase [Myxococcota bacterium]|nr:glutathione S-transferase [Myxococcota bacterium]
MTRSLVLAGGPLGSPYTHKVKSLLLYRRIPYQFAFVPAPGDAPEGFPKPPRPLFPCLYYPEADGTYRGTSDSTFQIRELEEHVPERSVIPTDPALAFLDSLLEDYADEWVTKMMFHYRWGVPENVEYASHALPLGIPGAPDSLVAFFKKTFAPRQIDRLSGIVTGSIEVTGPMIEASYVRLLKILGRLLAKRSFVLGNRPSACDFALQGQLVQLTRVEPTSTQLAREIAPRVKVWVEVMDDLSGWRVEGDIGWVERDDVAASLRDLFQEVGRTYAPFLVANAEALEKGEENMECQIDGQRYWQRAFPYQAKCLRWIREGYEELSSEDRAFVASVLSGTGTEVLLA